MLFLKEGEEVVFNLLLMYYIFVFLVNCLVLMSIGIINVFVMNVRDFFFVIKVMKDYFVMFVIGVNMFFNVLINYKDFSFVDFSSFKVIVGGGMVV